MLIEPDLLVYFHTPVKVLRQDPSCLLCPVVGLSSWQHLGCRLSLWWVQNSGMAFQSGCGGYLHWLHLQRHAKLISDSMVKKFLQIWLSF